MTFRFEKNSSLESKVYQAIGAASACWDNLAGAGIFDSSRAKEIGDALYEEIQFVINEKVRSLR